MKIPGLLTIEKINSLTEKICILAADLHARENRKHHARIGAWRHELYEVGLRHKLKTLEIQRTILLKRFTDLQL